MRHLCWFLYTVEVLENHWKTICPKFWFSKVSLCKSRFHEGGILHNCSTRKSLEKTRKLKQARYNNIILYSIVKASYYTTANCIIPFVVLFFRWKQANKKGGLSSFVSGQYFFLPFQELSCTCIGILRNIRTRRRPSIYGFIA